MINLNIRITDDGTLDKSIKCVHRYECCNCTNIQVLTMNKHVDGKTSYYVLANHGGTPEYISGNEGESIIKKFLQSVRDTGGTINKYIDGIKIVEKD